MTLLATREQEEHISVQGFLTSDHLLLLRNSFSPFNHPDMKPTVNAAYIDAQGFPGGSAGKGSACSVGDPSSILRLGRSPGEGNGNSLQYSCQENPHGQRSREGYSQWGHKKSDTTERIKASTHALASELHQVTGDIIPRGLSASLTWSHTSQTWSQETLNKGSWLFKSQWTIKS